MPSTRNTSSSPQVSARCTKPLQLGRHRGGDFSRITDPRRRRLSAVSNSRTRSSASSSISTSQSRMTRKPPWPLTAYPGNSRPTNSTVACSRVIRRTGPASAFGRRMNRSILLGTRISAFIARPSLARARCRAMVKPRLGMNGNGCAGSMASGVSTGKMWCRKWSSSQARSILVSVSTSTSRTLFSLEILAQLAPSRLLVARQHCHRVGDTGELLGRRQAIGAAGDDALAQRGLEAGHANHEELVKVVGARSRGNGPAPITAGSDSPPPPGRAG